VELLADMTDQVKKRPFLGFADGGVRRGGARWRVVRKVFDGGGMTGRGGWQVLTPVLVDNVLSPVRDRLLHGLDVVATTTAGLGIWCRGETLGRQPGVELLGGQVGGTQGERCMALHSSQLVGPGAVGEVSAQKAMS
jgi:hypothetical protein